MTFYLFMWQQVQINMKIDNKKSWFKSVNHITRFIVFKEYNMKDSQFSNISNLFTNY